MSDFLQFMFVIVDPKGKVQPITIDETRKLCISRFLSGSNVDWETASKSGWKCKRCTIDIRLHAAD